VVDVTRTADIVVAGAGHNSLVTAAYLAQAGYECAIVDARPIPGGGATTEELLMDGCWVDTCSTGHTLIQVNPLIRLDELGLVSTYGLSYIDPDPVEVVAFPDGETLTMWLDADATCSEIARFSEKDAEAYRRSTPSRRSSERPDSGRSVTGRAPRRCCGTIPGVEPGCDAA
jgi:phytoene dehydrogenase-like protein